MTREYYLKHREEVLAKNKLWKQNNKEKVRAVQNAYHKRRKQTDPEYAAKLKAQRAARYQQNKETALAQHRVWNEQNRDKTREHNRRYRAKLKTQRLVKERQQKLIEEYATRQADQLLERAPNNMTIKEVRDINRMFIHRATLGGVPQNIAEAIADKMEERYIN